MDEFIQRDASIARCFAFADLLPDLRGERAEDDFWQGTRPSKACWVCRFSAILCAERADAKSFGETRLSEVC